VLAVREVPPDTPRPKSAQLALQVADVLKLRLPAAKARIHRARMQVRARLVSWEESGASSDALHPP
jgi:hypothetical protein